MEEWHGPRLANTRTTTERESNHSMYNRCPWGVALLTVSPFSAGAVSQQRAVTPLRGTLLPALLRSFSSSHGAGLRVGRTVARGVARGHHSHRWIFPFHPSP
uniref:Uncharacterized protein n=1 Tax=Oryza punctata TaxID=4537 RepID=A0A0E0JNM2_ORYPU